MRLPQKISTMRTFPLFSNLTAFIASIVTSSNIVIRLGFGMTLGRLVCFLQGLQRYSSAS